MSQKIYTAYGGQVTTPALNQRFKYLYGISAVLSGMNVTPSGTNQLNLSYGLAQINGVTIEETSSLNPIPGITLASNTSGNPRIDVLALSYTHGSGNTAATYSIIQGTPAASPTVPGLGDSQLALAYITLPNNYAAVTAEMIGALPKRSLDTLYNILYDLGVNLFTTSSNNYGWYTGFGLTKSNLVATVAAGVGFAKDGRWVKTTTATNVTVPANSTGYIVYSSTERRFKFSATNTDGIYIGDVVSGASAITTITAAVITNGNAMPINATKLDGHDASDFLQLTGGTMTGTLTLNADPANPYEAATKGYVDAARQGLDVKASVRAATTGNITLSNTQSIDGVTLAAGDRVLVKDQTTPAQNGIYVVVSGGAWTRATDADSSTKVTYGMYTFVEAGTVNANSGWVLSTTSTTPPPITVGTTALTFTQFTGAGAITTGAGLTRNGNVLSVDTSSSLMQTFATTTGDTARIADTKEFRFEVRTNRTDPTNPAVGRCWLRTDL